QWLMSSFCAQSEAAEADRMYSHSADTETSVESHRRWCIDQLVALIRNQKIPKSTEMVFSTLRFMILHAFYSQSKSVKDEQVPEMAMMCEPELSLRSRDTVRMKAWALI